MSSTMIDYPDAVWNKQQPMQHLTRTHRLLGSDVFTSKAPFSATSQACWIELNLAVSDSLRQSQLVGKRIKFTNDIATSGEPITITGLLDTMQKLAYIVRAIPLTQSDLTIIHNGSGTGNFASGLFFNSRYKYELAFFVDRDRIFFYRHLMRAFIESSQFLKSLPAVS